MDGLRYENFVRSAFEFKQGGTVGRGEDPAALAEAGYTSTNDLNKVKAGTAYAMEIYSSYIRNQANVTDQDYQDIDQLLDDVINASNTADVSHAINRYKSTFFTKYSL